MIILWLLAIPVFLVVAGLCDAINDRFRDSKLNNPVYFFFERHPVVLGFHVLAWYLGNDDSNAYTFKNNGNPFQSDFWHNVKLVKIYCWTLAVCCGLATSLGWYAFLASPLIAFVVGKLFTFFYHKVFRETKK
jgi:hypothetical protein